MRSSPIRTRSRCSCAGTASTSGAPTGSRPKRTPSATTISFARPSKCGGSASRPASKKGETAMWAFRLDEPAHSISPDALASLGVLSWTVSRDDAERAATIETIKRERGYVDEDFVALNAATPNIDAICAKFDAEHVHTEVEARFVEE